MRQNSSSSIITLFIHSTKFYNYSRWAKRERNEDEQEVEWGGVGHFLETKNEKLIDEEKINKLREGEGHRKMNR